MQEDTLEDKVNLHSVTCCDRADCRKLKKPRTLKQKIQAWKPSKHKKDEVAPTAKKVLPHLPPLVLQFHKKKSSVGRNTPKEGTTKDVVTTEGATKEVEDEYSTREDDFYSNFCPKEDDLWRSLEEEVAAIQQFLSKK